MSIKRFEDLLAWQKSYELCRFVFQITKHFPKEEIYGLAAHIRKTALSCPSNIAEGYERRNNKEFNTFLRIALGSIGELKTQLLLAKDLGYISTDNFEKSIILLEDSRKIIHGLRKSIIGSH
jgi:four helix bundle protein